MSGNLSEIVSALKGGEDVVAQWCHDKVLFASNDVDPVCVGGHFQSPLDVINKTDIGIVDFPVMTNSYGNSIVFSRDYICDPLLGEEG